ncbi:MAG: hypothetical protein QMB63_05415 [Clostridiaceae bacterium]
MIKIVLLILFLLASFYNYSISRKNIVNVKKEPILFILIAMFGVIVLFLCYKYDNTFLGYLVVLGAFLLVISISITPGISKEGINIILGNAKLNKQVKFNEISKISYNDIAKDKFKITINAFSNEYNQIYDISNKSKVLKLLKLKN